MTQEEQKLLLQDLSARLPYKVMVCVNNDRKPLPLKGITFEEESKMFNTPSRYACEIGGGAYSHIYVKPFLRPMSSMTKEERKELNNQGYTKIAGELYHYCALSSNNAFYNPERYSYVRMEYVIKLINWLNSHHFDYRGLIEKGLALEAPEGMYDIKEQ